MESNFFSKDKLKKYKSLYENPPDLKTAHSIIGGLVKNIYAYHNSLGIIWDGFKNSLKRYRESTIGGWEVEYFTIKIDHKISLNSKNIEIKIEETYIESPGGESSLVSLRITEQFLDLIEGLSFNRFRECKACKRWFVSTYSGEKRQKHCCSNRCSSRINKYDMRHNPKRRNQYNKEKKYQKKRYRKKVLGSDK